MYYITKALFNRNKFGVTDSSDGVEEFFTSEELVKIAGKLKIEGLQVIGGTIKFAVPSTPDLIRLESSPIGTPFRIKLKDTLDWRQCLYGGCEYTANNLVNYKIIDGGSRLNNHFLLTNRYVLEHKDECKFDFNNNDPEKISILLKEMGR